MSESAANSQEQDSTTLKALTRFRAILDDKSQIDWLRVYAVAVLSLFDLCLKFQLPFKVYSAGDLVWDESNNIQVGDSTFTLSSNYGVYESYYGVELKIGGADGIEDWLRITPDGAAVPKDGTNLDHGAFWWFNEHLDMVPQVMGIQIASTIFTCGRWRDQGLSGLMESCEQCPLKESCTITTKYSIKEEKLLI